MGYFKVFLQVDIKNDKLFLMIKVFTLIFYLFLISLFFPPPSLAFFANCVNAQDFKCLGDIYWSVLQVAVSGASIGFFIMILSGGIKWLTSSGDPKDIENAKGRITFAVFGLILFIASWFILKFISKFTGNITEILHFNIPSL